MTLIELPDRATAPARAVRVLVVDDREIIQLGLHALFRSSGWVERCFVTKDPVVAERIARRDRPHLVIVDHRLDRARGLSIVRRIKAAAPRSRIVYLSDAHRLFSSTSASEADAMVSDDAPLSEILETSARVMSGGSRRSNPEESSLVALSIRESEVLAKIADGLSNPEIAVALHLSRHTVKQHTSTLYRKLGVRNRAEAAGLARQWGLVA